VVSRKLFITGILLIIGVFLVDLVWGSIDLWRSYQGNEIYQYWLPPHSTIVYEHIARLAQPLMVRLIMAAVVFVIFIGLKKKLKLEQYGIDDVYLLAISALASSWPGFLIALAAIFVVLIFASLIIRLRLPNKEDAVKLIITPYILPVTTIIIWFMPYINNVTGLEKIRF